MDTILKIATTMFCLGKRGKSVTIVDTECFVLSECIDIAREK
jgi:hypothetical protein